MRVTQDALREAENAVELAKSEHPLLDHRGLGPYDHPDVPNQHSLDTPYGREQVATGMAALKALRLSERTDAYAVKHHAEQWGRRNGMATYVSTGAIIAAAVGLGIDVHRDRVGNVSLG
jgi:hypothetical protein